MAEGGELPKLDTAGGTNPIPGGGSENLNRHLGVLGTPADPDVAKAAIDQALAQFEKNEDRASLKNVPITQSTIHTGSGIGNRGYMGPSSRDTNRAASGD